jgi:hypothetical protein
MGVPVSLTCLVLQLSTFSSCFPPYMLHFSVCFFNQQLFANHHSHSGCGAAHLSYITFFKPD